MYVRYQVELSQAEGDQLTEMLSGGKHAARKLTRAQILLSADSGVSDPAIAAGVCGSCPARRRRCRSSPPVPVHPKGERACRRNRRRSSVDRPCQRVCVWGRSASITPRKSTPRASASRTAWRSHPVSRDTGWPNGIVSLSICDGFAGWCACGAKPRRDSAVICPV